MGAWLVFPDESGLLLGPLVRATWALRGVTPRLSQVMNHRQKISAIGALCVSPDRGRVRLYLLFFPKENIDGDLVEHFLGELLRHLRGAVMVMWDRIGVHRSDAVEEFLEAHPRLRAWAFPPHCPELNPVEYLWRWLKWDKLANFAPKNLKALEEEAGALVRQACSDQRLLRSFIMQCELPLELEAQTRAFKG